MHNGFTKREVGSPRQRCPKPPLRHWIEIELVGEDDAPIPWEEYRVVPPDGQTIKGYLDENGWARVDGLEDAGACEVSFPQLDRDACNYVKALEARGAGPGGR